LTQRRIKPISAFCLGFFLALTFYWVAATSSGFDWAREWRLAQTSLRAEAVVIRTEPQNHCAAYYEFEVDGQKYQGSAAACSARIGDKFNVFYLPGDPAFSTVKTPGSDLLFMIFAPLVMSVIAGIVVMAQLGRPGK